MQTPSRIGPTRRMMAGYTALIASGLAGLLTQFGDAGASSVFSGGGVSRPPADRPPIAPDAMLAADSQAARALPPPRWTRVTPTATDRAEWAAFRARFISADGRIIDNGNGGVSHSEGQGWGLLFAAVFDDRELFDRILRWTERHLRRGSDHLHSWRFRPNDPNPVSDLNNATDGDLFIAGALARAAMRWGNRDYANLAAAMAQDILRLLTRQTAGRTVLLPGAAGFERGSSLTINLSYYAFALFPDLARLAPSPIWQKLFDDGLQLIDESRFGPWRLPPDWLQINTREGRIDLPSDKAPRFSFDAIRIPLNITWSMAWQPSTQARFRDFWRGPHPHLPAWVDLRTSAISDYPAPPGLQAVAILSTRTRHLDVPNSFPSVKAAVDYYSAALIVLSRIAWGECLMAE